MIQKITEKWDLANILTRHGFRSEYSCDCGVNFPQLNKCYQIFFQVTDLITGFGNVQYKNNCHVLANAVRKLGK